MTLSIIQLSTQVSADVPDNRILDKTGMTKPLYAARLPGSWLPAQRPPSLPALRRPIRPANGWSPSRLHGSELWTASGRLWGVVPWEATPGCRQAKIRIQICEPTDFGDANPSRDGAEPIHKNNGKARFTIRKTATLIRPISAWPIPIRCGCKVAFLASCAAARTGARGNHRIRRQAHRRKSRRRNRRPRAKRPAPAGPLADKTASAQPESSADVCLRVLGPAGLSHERGLK